MKLTEEQRLAVGVDEHIMLTACPGSGKTRVIISKLARTVDAIRGSARAIACITYTNAAVHEIEARLRYHIQPGDDIHFEIATIHSFCLNNIFRPFRHLVHGYKDGFKVLTSESVEFEAFARRAAAEWGRHNLTVAELDEFAQLRVDREGNPVGDAIDRGGLTPDMARSFWSIISQAGFIDFANIIYHSLILLREHEEILSYVAAKFAWILVDEFQDTSDLQVELLTLIESRKQSRFFLVGDPFQSIFSFAGARPDLATKFAAAIGARTDLQLSGNFRSSAAIIRHANLLYSRHPAMVPLGEGAEYPVEPAWEHSVSASIAIVDHFLPTLEERNIPFGDAAVLAPTWFTLVPIARHLREYGVPVVGPGARPYKRYRHFAVLAEHVCGYLVDPQPASLPALERTLFNTLQDVTGRAYFNVFSYEGRIVLYRLLEIAKVLYNAGTGGLAWLHAAVEAFAALLVAEGYLTVAEMEPFVRSAREMELDMLKNNIDVANLTIEDLGLYASPETALKLSTLHNAKGREYMAVALVDLHEGRIPHYYARTDEAVEEAKRAFYVGVTRAKRLLYYFTDNSGRNGPSRFLSADGVGVC